MTTREKIGAFLFIGGIVIALVSALVSRFYDPFADAVGNIAVNVGLAVITLGVVLIDLEFVLFMLASALGEVTYIIGVNIGDQSMQFIGLALTIVSFVVFALFIFHSIRRHRK